MRTVVSCDGAGPLACGEDEQLLECISDPESGRCNFRIEPIETAFGGPVPAIAADLVRIASYAYFADQMVPRAQPTDVFGDRWIRDFRIVAPLEQPEVWSDSAVLDRLRAALESATGDRWDFQFCPGQPTQVAWWLPGMPLPDVQAKADCVATFSGGIDSLVAALDLVSQGRSPLLVSHISSTVLKGRRQQLREQMAPGSAASTYPTVDVHINKIGIQEKDSTQRTRAFLYSSLAAALAASAGIDDVVVADNGYVSSGIPLNRAVFGTMASRATHPVFVHRFNQLMAALGLGVRVRNPLLLMTRCEVLRRLKDLRSESLLALTVSCSASRGLSKEAAQCGTCSQCIDRQVAVVAAGMGEWDSTYKADVFVSELHDKQRTIAESYVRLARELAQLDPQGMLLRFSELVEFSKALSGDQLNQVCEMLRRHGIQALEALGSVAWQHMDEVMAGKILPSAMVRIAMSSDIEAPELPWELPPIELSGEQETQFEEWRCVGRLRIDVEGFCDDDQCTEVQLDQQSLFISPAEFELFFILICRLFTDARRNREKEPGWVEFEGPGGLKELRGDIDFYKALERLRKTLKPFLDGIKPTRFIETEDEKARLATHPAYVHVEWAAMRAHPNRNIARLARATSATLKKKQGPGGARRRPV
jgi:7-cyano-7-deazaguanine synthase in queuosine biosynthesis